MSPQRRRRGEAHHNAKLSEGQVRTIRALQGSEGKDTSPMLAQRYGVTTEQIRRIWARTRWAHLSDAS